MDMYTCTKRVMYEICRLKLGLSKFEEINTNNKEKNLYTFYRVIVIKLDDSYGLKVEVKSRVNRFGFVSYLTTYSLIRYDFSVRVNN